MKHLFGFSRDIFWLKLNKIIVNSVEKEANALINKGIFYPINIMLWHAIATVIDNENNSSSF